MPPDGKRFEVLVRVRPNCCVSAAAAAGARLALTASITAGDYKILRKCP